MSYKKILIGLFTGICVVWLGGYIALFYTPLPLQMLGKLGESIGIHSEGITGNLAGGMQAQTISVHNEYVDADIRDLGVRHSSIWKQFYQKIYTVEDLHLGSAKIIIKRWPEKKGASIQRANPQKRANPAEDASPEEKADLDKALAALHLEYQNIHIGNLEIKTPEMEKSWKMDHLDVKNLIAQKKEVTLESFSFKSDGVDLQLAAGKINEAMGQIGSLKVVLTPGLYAQIAKPIDMEGKMQYWFKPVEGKASFAEFKAFDGKITAQMDPKMNVAIQTQDWTPFEYIKNLPPLSHLNLKTQTNFMFLALGLTNWTGDFNLGQAKFALQSRDVKKDLMKTVTGAPADSPFWVASSDYNTVHYDLDFFVRPETFLGKPASGPWIKLRANKSGTSDRHLAFLLFGKDTGALNPEESKFLVLSGTQIALSAPAAPLPIAKAVSKKPARKFAQKFAQKNRAPASR